MRPSAIGRRSTRSKCVTGIPGSSRRATWYDPQMKIAKIESLHADAGQRNFDFLKITTDDGLVGWSEYNESFGGVGVSAAIAGLAPALIGKDPRAWEALVTLMYMLRRPGEGSVIRQAIGAIENALLDVTARAHGVPVYALFGGPVRERI